MSEQPKPRPYLSAAEIAAAPEVHIRHPLNPASDVYLRALGRLRRPPAHGPEPGQGAAGPRILHLSFP